MAAIGMTTLSQVKQMSHNKSRSKWLLKASQLALGKWSQKFSDFSFECSFFNSIQYFLRIVFE